jgi:transcriptional regulator with XRE-family HTH domain
VKGDKMAKIIELVLECMKEKKMTQTELAKSLGEDVRVINQQLHRQKDLKAERFLELMEHIGYRVEIVDNEGVRKVYEGMIDDIQDGAVRGNMFYAEKEDGTIIGIYYKEEELEEKEKEDDEEELEEKSKNVEFEVKEFGNKPDCFGWLISHAQAVGKVQE